MSDVKRWRVEWRWASSTAGVPKIYTVKGAAPFDGTEYTDEEQANAVVAELNRLHTPIPVIGSGQPLRVGPRQPNEPDFTPR